MRAAAAAGRGRAAALHEALQRTMWRAPTARCRTPPPRGPALWNKLHAIKFIIIPHFALKGIWKRWLVRYKIAFYVLFPHLHVKVFFFFFNVKVHIQIKKINKLFILMYVSFKNNQLEDHNNTDALNATAYGFDFH